MKAPRANIRSRSGTPDEYAVQKTWWLRPSVLTGKNAEAVGVDQERVFIRAMRCASIFHNAKPTRRNLIVHAVVESRTQSETYSSKPWRVKEPSRALR